MHAEERTIASILTEQMCYEIPPYQRPYSWKTENVTELLEDVWEAYTTNEPEYFIGSLITIEKEKNLRYEIVDGQQRLTTLNLLFARLRDHIADSAAKAALGGRIQPRDPFTGKSDTPRLTLRSADRSFFRQHVIDSEPLPQEITKLSAPQQRIAENIVAIDDFCKGKDEKTLKLLTNYVLTKVYVVFVNTDSWKSAYRLFNVLNARGMSLSNADLIKNRLFSMLADEEHRSQELEERWLELEQIIGIDRLDSFLGHHRTSLMANRQQDTLHEEFEPTIKAAGSPFTFIENMIGSAENYMRIIDSEFTDPKALRAIHALHRVEYDEWIPPLLAYLNKPVSGLTESEFAGLLEKITMQNWVRRLGRTARLTTYYQLISAVKNGEGEAAVREIFRKNARNQEFIDLLGGELYGKPFDAAVLLRLDEACQDDSVTRIYNGRMTIEHVLPQAFKEDYWKQRFTEEQQKLWLHRLGNLAMLSGSKNYRAQYYDFDRKKKIYEDRNKVVSFDLTKELCSLPEWNANTLETRHNNLLLLAKETWEIV